MANTYEPSLKSPAAIIMWLRNFVVVGNDNECWYSISNTKSFSGYSMVSQTIDGKQKVNSAHRIMWELFNGPIPDGMVIDHMCHNEAWANGQCDGGTPCLHRKCVNPNHLRMTTKGENSKAGAAGLNENRGKCRNQLHDWIPENIIERAGRRWCKLCRNTAVRKTYWKNKGVKPKVGK